MTSSETRGEWLFQNSRGETAEGKASAISIKLRDKKGFASSNTRLGGGSSRDLLSKSGNV